MRAPLVMLVLVIGLWVLSMLTSIGAKSIQPASGRYVEMVMSDGAVFLGVATADVLRDPRLEEDPILKDGVWIEWNVQSPVWLPWFSKRGVWLSIGAPIWCFIAPTSVWFAIAIVRHRQRRGLCPCGYDARGLDACPECGRDVKA